MALDQKDRDLLEQINKKLLSSSVLNGGFDKLVVVVTQIKDKQDETSDKIDAVQKALYEPTTGLFSRMQAAEQDITVVDDNLESYNKDNETVHEVMKIELKNLSKDDTRLDATIAKLETMSTKLDSTKEANEVAERLKRIAGVDLEDLSDIVKLKKQGFKIYWGLVGLFVLSLVKLLWDVASTHR